MAQVIRSARVEDDPVLISYGPPPSPPAQVASAEIREPAAEKPEVALEELRRQAFEDGYREGQEKGEAAAMAERAAGLEQLKALVLSVREALDQGIAGMEEVAVEIAFAAACKIVGQAAPGGEAARSLVREAMREVRAREGAVLRLSSHDYAAVGAALGEEHGVAVVADERVVAGGCLIETAGGTLDARLDVQLRQLLDVLVRAREAQAEE